VGELPQGGVVFPEDLVLAVVLNQVFPKTNITVRDKKVQRDEIVFKKFKLHHHQSNGQYFEFGNLLDEVIVDDCGLNSLLVFLSLGFVLEVILDLSSHLYEIYFICCFI
jgi:hypothetical protein